MEAHNGATRLPSADMPLVVKRALPRPNTQVYNKPAPHIPQTGLPSSPLPLSSPLATPAVRIHL